MSGTMDRRLLLFVAACACWPAGRVFAQDEAARPRHKISAATLHALLSARFPVQFGLGGLLALEVSAPRLHLLPARNQLGATLVAQLSGVQVPQLPPGEMDVVFSLRYEPADRSVRAYRPDILEVRWPGFPPETAKGLQKVLPAMMGEAVGEVVLHEFSPSELALADTMGFEPETITVVDDGLVIEFGPKRRR
jgi:hypothetical protein